MNYKGKAIPVSYDYLALEQRTRKENQSKSIEEQEALKRQDELLSGQAIPLPSEAAIVQQNKVMVDKSSGLTFLDKIENSLSDLWRSAKMIPRAGGEMIASSPFGAVTDIIGGTANLALPEQYQLPSTKQTFQGVFDYAGLPQPTPDEQDILDVAGYAGGAELYRKGAQGLGKTLLTPKSPTQQVSNARDVTGRVVTELGKGTPGLTVAAGAGGGAGLVTAENQGATPAEAMLASVFGSGLAMLPAVAVNELRTLITSARTPEAQQMLKDRMNYWLSVVKDRAAIPASAIAPNRLTRSAEQSASNLAGGSGIMAETAEGIQGAVQQRVDEVSRELAGSGVEISPETAGAAVQGIFKQGSEGVNKQSWEYGFSQLSKKRFGEVEKKLGNLKVVPKNFMRVLSAGANRLTGIKGAEQSSMASNTALQKDLQIFTDAFAQNNGAADINTIRQLRSFIGDKIKTGVFASDSGIDNQTYRALYAALSDDIEGSIKDPLVRKMYRETNASYAKELDTLSRIHKVVRSSGGGEKLYQAIINQSAGGSRLIKDIYARLPQRDRRLFTATVMEEFIKARPGQQSLMEDVPSVRAFMTEFNKLRPEARNTLFSDSSFGKTYLKDMDAIKRVMDDIEKQKGYLPNPSGSGRVQSAAISGGSAIAGGLAGYGLGGQSATGAVIGTLFGLAPTAASYGTAKIMTNPSFVRWLASGSKLPAKPAAMNAWLSQLGVVAEKDEELREVHKNLTDALIKEQTEYKPKVPESLEGRAVPYELQ